VRRCPRHYHPSAFAGCQAFRIPPGLGDCYRIPVAGMRDSYSHRNPRSQKARYDRNRIGLRCVSLREPAFRLKSHPVWDHPRVEPSGFTADVKRCVARGCPGAGDRLLAVANFGSHTSFLAANFATSLTCFLRSHSVSYSTRRTIRQLN